MQNRWSALHIAVGRNNTCAIDALLVAKVDVDATTTAGWTPLMLAYMNEHQDAVCALRRHGVDVTAKCVLGNTAADYARHPLVVCAPNRAQKCCPLSAMPSSHCMIGCRDWQRHTPVIVQVTHEFAAFCYLSLQFTFELKSRTIIYFDAMTVPLSLSRGQTPHPVRSMRTLQTRSKIHSLMIFCREYLCIISIIYRLY